MYKIQEYLELLQRTGYKTQNNPLLRIITENVEICDNMAKTGSEIGIVYRGAYNTFVVDLLEDSNGNRFAHERIIKNHPDNSVVVVPVYNGKFVLLKQFRYSMNDYQLSFPRGNGEVNISAENNAVKEIIEELHSEVISLKRMNKVISDSGICGDMVNIFVCEITEPAVKAGYEGIESYCLVSYNELKQMIVNGMINDGFTLAAFAMLKD